MKNRILVVDDSQSIRRKLRLLLEPAGFQIFEADNGLSGKNVAEANQVDLVICDVNMPVMTGFEMVSELRKLQFYQDTPIFMLTTESSRLVAQRGKDSGVTAWLVKPFNPEILLKGIKKVLAR